MGPQKGLGGFRVYRLELVILMLEIFECMLSWSFWMISHTGTETRHISLLCLEGQSFFLICSCS